MIPLSKTHPMLYNVESVDPVKSIVTLVHKWEPGVKMIWSVMDMAYSGGALNTPCYHRQSIRLWEQTKAMLTEQGYTIVCIGSVASVRKIS